MHCQGFLIISIDLASVFLEIVLPSRITLYWVVSRSLSSSSASTLVHAFIANRLDYCSSLYCELPQVRLRPLNGVLRAAARMIGGVPKFGHISDYMRDVLHWLPVQQRIHYRISSIVWH